VRFFGELKLPSQSDLSSGALGENMLIDDAKRIYRMDAPKIWAMRALERLDDPLSAQNLLDSLEIGLENSSLYLETGKALIALGDMTAGLAALLDELADPDGEHDDCFDQLRQLGPSAINRALEVEPHMMTSLLCYRDPTVLTAYMADPATTESSALDVLWELDQRMNDRDQFSLYDTMKATPPVLLAALKNPAARVREKAVELIADVEQSGHYEGDEHITEALAEALIKVLSDDDDRVRFRSAIALWQFLPNYPWSESTLLLALEFGRNALDAETLHSVVEMLLELRPDARAVLVPVFELLECLPSTGRSAWRGRTHIRIPDVNRPEQPFVDALKFLQR
jgi:hypothetical protein